MEYIGATGIPINMDDVPIRDGLDFYFIYGFAIDADTEGNYNDGVFLPYWTSTLTPQALQGVQERHPKVKAMASLAGWSVYTNQGKDKVIAWYNPKDPNKWVDNAFNSLSQLIKDNHLDGIDIDYENFPVGKNNTFAYCIGELIKRLKNSGVINTATIAPYYKTVGPYIELFQKYGSFIDYVNHQFYTDKVIAPVKFVNDFVMRASQFDPAKLLPSYEVDGRGIQGEGFFTALGLIQKNFTVNGIMIFSADASAKPGNNNSYYYESRSQDFLLGINSSMIV
ncbi:chitinase 2-like [Cryptomeria japonica]|uniref:chitinase 2-like n=1 Tax=Cryptomeria japonica TaxID=3369 RepID=UPI0027DA2517|nr:chitinase 2-like [Cryptomeria japonica]